MERAKVELRDCLRPSGVRTLAGRGRDDVLVEMVDLAAADPAVTDRDALLAAVREREELLSTGIGLGIAIPHARIPSVREFVVAVGRQPLGIDFRAIDGRPVTIVVLIAGPQDAQKPYLELLAQLSRKLKIPEVRARITSGADAEEVVSLLTV